MRRGPLFWGTILILFGSLLLANNFGLLPPGTNVFSLIWPVLLIVLGIMGITQAFSRRSSKAEILTIPLEGATSARIVLSHGAGELNLNDQAGAGELLDGAFNGGIENHIQRSTDSVSIDLKAPDISFPFYVPFDSDRLRWNIGLNRNIPLSLEIETGASQNTLDLKNLLVKDLRLATGASSTEIYFPSNAGETRAVLKSGAATVSAFVPAGVAARIEVDSGLSSINIDTARFPQHGDGYESPDFASAENRLILEIETGVGSITVH